MTKDAKRFKQMETIMTAVLIAATVLFIIYLIAAGNGIIWLKAVTAIITILVCGLCLAYLYVTKLLLRPKTMWMTLAAGAIIICLLFSLILNFPAKL
ncbi:MAG: hypothetical protein IJY91_02490 [Oscillospiraceae bacterium]|nr:hypothetical protein [Oscillospiraceae bacterium]